MIRVFAPALAGSVIIFQADTVDQSLQVVPPEVQGLEDVVCLLAEQPVLIIHDISQFLEEVGGGHHFLRVICRHMEVKVFGLDDIEIALRDTFHPDLFQHE